MFHQANDTLASLLGKRVDGARNTSFTPGESTLCPQERSNGHKGQEEQPASPSGLEGALPSASNHRRTEEPYPVQRSVSGGALWSLSKSVRRNFGQLLNMELLGFV